jgi:hypothetical protein
MTRRRATRQVGHTYPFRISAGKSEVSSTPDEQLTSITCQLLIQIQGFRNGSEKLSHSLAKRVVMVMPLIGGDGCRV